MGTEGDAAAQHHHFHRRFDAQQCRPRTRHVWGTRQSRWLPRLTALLSLELPHGAKKFTAPSRKEFLCCSSLRKISNSSEVLLRLTRSRLVRPRTGGFGANSGLDPAWASRLLFWLIGAFIWKCRSAVRKFALLVETSPRSGRGIVPNTERQGGATGDTMATYFAATALVGLVVWGVLGLLLQDN
jgi:hypothetical protein